MTIDINELCRKLQSDDFIDRIDIHANVKPVLTELLDRLEAAEKERDALRAAIEAIENSRNEEESTACKSDDDLSDEALWAGIAAGMITPAHIARSTVAEQEEIEKERDALRAAVQHEADCVEACKSEIDALRAKIEQMERQEPACWAPRFALNLGGSALSFDACRNNLWGDEGVPLYTIPGAKGE